MTDIHYWLALYRAPAIGAATFTKLIEHFGSPKAVIESDRDTVSALNLNPTTRQYLNNPDWKGVEDDLRWRDQLGHEILTYPSRKYPSLLKEIPGSAPPVLFVHGNVDLLESSQLAIVGSRNPTAPGKELAHEFGRALSQLGFTVTSGLALGIDAAAHRGAMAGAGLTIAVAATGLDRVYPARHRGLAHQVVEQNGTLISEFPVGTPPRREHFPRRNRIISGLSLGTLVVEAALRSGSLITARFAADQGREVFAIPGSIHSPLSKGCHALIREGAKLAETADDIIEEIAPKATLVRPGSLILESGNERDHDLRGNFDLVFKALGYDPTSVDRVIERTGLTAEEVSSILLELELHGHITSMSGGMYTRQALRGAK